MIPPWIFNSIAIAIFLAQFVAVAIWWRRLRRKWAEEDHKHKKALDHSITMLIGGLSLDLYQAAALRTKAPHNTLECAALGICGEGGEFADLVKKHVYHSHELDRVKAAKELGDVLWYLALGAEVLGFTLGEIGRMNIEKLSKRYKDGFSVAESKHNGQ